MPILSQNEISSLQINCASFNAISKILILGINLPLIIFYTPLFKNVPFIGNIIIAFILSMVFIVSAMYLEGDLFQITPPAILAFLLMLIREVVKDVADYEGDKDLKYLNIDKNYKNNVF